MISNNIPSCWFLSPSIGHVREFAFWQAIDCDRYLIRKFYQATALVVVGGGWGWLRRPDSGGKVSMSTTSTKSKGAKSSQRFSFRARGRCTHTNYECKCEIPDSSFPAHPLRDAPPLPPSTFPLATCGWLPQGKGGSNGQQIVRTLRSKVKNELKKKNIKIRQKKIKERVF